MLFVSIRRAPFADIPFSFAYIIPMKRYGSAITPEQTKVPKKVFAVMGALDGLCGIMQIFASTYLGGSLIILLSQVTGKMKVSKRLRTISPQQATIATTTKNAWPAMPHRNL